MPLLNEKLKMISCSDFRSFLKKMINDKIEKEWTENFVENLNFIMVSRNTIKRRFEDKGIDIIKLINDVSYYKHVKKRVNSRGNLEFQHKY
jgi:translation elongation factor EF-Ts|tara:strand:+ start:293 stop:565 length:273 start_codon:yes stop_codon:yes gene_type:complete